MAIKPAGAPKRRSAPPKRPKVHAGGGPSGRAEARMMQVPARFNAARFYIDRHVAEGRGSRTAFLHEGGALTYAGLQELVDRDRQRAAGSGRAPGAAGALPAARLAGVPGHLLGRDQDRRDPDPGEHHDAGRGLPVLPRRQPGPGRGGLGGAARRGRTRAREGVAPAARGGGGAHLREPDRLRRLGGRGAAAVSSPSTAARTIPRSGSTRRARPGARRARCTCSTTWWCAARPTRKQVLGMTESDRTVSAAKLFFAYGLGNNMYFPAPRGRPGRCCTRTGRRRTRCSR